MKTKLFLLGITICINSYAQINFIDHIIIDDTNTVQNLKDIDFIDIDGDNDLDILSLSFEDSKIA